MQFINTVMASYNAAGTIARAIDSFAAQDHPAKRLIVVDGGSTDGTLDILQRYADVVHWRESAPDRGIYDAWNKAIGHIPDGWVHFLGADDFYPAADVFTRIAALLADQPSDLVYGDVRLTRPDGTFIETAGGPWNAARFRTVGMTIPHQGAFHRRNLFDIYGLFDDADPATSDYEFLLRYLKDHDAAYIGPLEVACMAVGGVSSRPENHLRFFRAYRAAQKAHGTFVPNWRLGAKFAEAYFRHMLFAALPRRQAIRVLDRMRVARGRAELYRYT